MTRSTAFGPALRASALALTFALAATPLTAGNSDAGSDNPELAEGVEMLSEGFRKMFRGLMGELEPAGEAAEQGWNDLIDWLGDLSVYEAPEQLPNGDIIIRRKPGAGLPETGPETGMGQSTDL